MKTAGNILFFVLVVFAPCNTHAQFELNYFFADQLDDKIQLNWEVKQGSTCNGMQIERSTDSINYSIIGQIDGICGSGSSAQKFDFTDTDPVPFQKNHYRLVAGTGERFYQSLFFSHVDESFFMVPNPVSLSSTIYFEPGQTFIVTFYEINGKLIKSSAVSQTAISMGQLLSAIPNSPFLLHVQAKNGSQVTKKLIGIN
jgi:hypothetical protein